MPDFDDFLSGTIGVIGGLALAALLVMGIKLMFFGM